MQTTPGSVPSPRKRHSEVVTRGSGVQGHPQHRDFRGQFGRPNILFQNKQKAGELGPWVKVLAAETDDLSATLSTHIVEVAQ